MYLSKRATVVLTVLAMTAVGVPAFAGGHGGGGGGGGNPGTKPYDEFKGGGNFTVTEGTLLATIQVERVPKGTDSVKFSTNGSPNGAVGGADCTTNPATDFIVVTDAVVSIGSNGVGVTHVPICNNDYFENPELVNLRLSQNTGGSPVGGKITGTLTINDNDKAPVLSVNNQTGAEGTTQTYTVTASSANPLLPMSVHWAAGDGTAKLADGDYLAQSGDVAIAPGNTTATFDVTSRDDSVFEPGTDEYFWVNLSAPVNASVSSTMGNGKYTVQDITSAPTFAIADGSSNEGNSGQTGESFQVTMSGPSSAAMSVHWSTSAISNAKGWNIGDARNDCAHNATDGTDLVSDAGTLGFPAGTVTQNIMVQLCGDVDPEVDEVFLVELDSPSYGSITEFQGLGTIVNDDGADTQGFETGLAGSGWTPYHDGDAPDGAVSTDQANTGTQSVLLGTPDNGCSGEPFGTSGIYRDFAVPAGTTTLHYSVFEVGDGFNDGLFAEIRDPNTDALIDTIFNDGATFTGLWDSRTADLTSYASSTVRIFFGVFQDGVACPSSMYVDDVYLTTV